MKILPTGVAVLESDSHISRWVEQSDNRLNIAEGLLNLVYYLIPVGGTVVDVGACIGDHTITYAQWVGPLGHVHAFEPCKDSFDCLVHNMAAYPWVLKYNMALGDTKREICVHTDPNAGASWVRDDRLPNSTTHEQPLDDFNLEALDFIKIDAEGYEPFVLSGARHTIEKFKPGMFIEVNKGALHRQGKTNQGLIQMIKDLGYAYVICPPSENENSEQFDVICVHESKLGKFPLPRL